MIFEVLGNGKKLKNQNWHLTLYSYLYVFQIEG